MGDENENLSPVSARCGSVDTIQVAAGALNVTLERSGERGGWPVVLLHGFPYDVRCFDQVAVQLARAGAEVVVPYLRGYGPTRFLRADTIRSGQQAALANDLLSLIDALELDRPIVAGFDWGGRAACLVSALWPEQVAGLVTAAGYNVQDIGKGLQPAEPAVERTLWYQFYLHGDRGRAGLARHRVAFARTLWSEWSPSWAFSDDDLGRTAGSFDNPDFVDVVVHSYRHRYGLAAGDPAYQATEDAIATQPVIGLPTIVLDGAQDTVTPAQPRSQHASHFAELIDHRLLVAGHNLPQERPDDFARAILDLHGQVG